MSTIRTTDFREERPNVAAHLASIQNQRHPISLLLDGVHDMRNIGSIFRLSDAALLHKVYFYRLPEPLDFRKVKRTSRSTHLHVPYEQLDSLEAVQQLRSTHQFTALEITNTSVPHTEISIQSDREQLLVIGNEQQGVSEEILQLVEQSIHIPMYGINTSMNVSVATGIAVYELLRQLKVGNM